MMQIGMQPLSRAFADGPLPQPDEATGTSGRESRSVPELSRDTADDILFVSPPPLALPRVLPGL